MDSWQLGVPDWSGQARRRLLVSCAMSAFCIATVVLVLRFPVAAQSRPFAELLVHILVEEARRPDSGDPAEARDVDDQAPEQPLLPADTPAPQADAVEMQQSPRDWYAEIPEAVTSTLDNAPQHYSVNPVFDEKRRLARDKFRPSRAPHEVPIWENVGKDTLGRSVLWAGDCYRVLDDPNVGNRDAFETFGQYIVSCAARADTPQELRWVREIRSRRASQARYGRPAAE